MGYKVTTGPRPVKPRFDVHRVKQLEIEIFGKEWWKVFGHVCDCGPCNPPKSLSQPAPGGRAPEFKPKGEVLVPRKRFIDGVMWPMPDGVPDNAHFEVIGGRWGYANHFHEGVWKWTSNVHGGTMFIKVIGIGSKELAPAYRQREAHTHGQRSLGG